MSSSPLKWYGIIDSHKNLEESMTNFAVITVPADGQAPLGAWPSAGTVMTKHKSV